MKPDLNVLLLNAARKALCGPLAYSQVSTKKPLLYLTFDDGPHPKYTPPLLSFLERKKIPATFFMSGKQIEKHPALAREVAEAGHPIGNHAYSHRRLVFKPSQILRDEIRKTDDLIHRIGGPARPLFRPPYGWFGWELGRVLRGLERLSVFWSLNSRDYAQPRRDVFLGRLNRELHNGAVILLHDGDSALTRLPEYLNAFLDLASQRGFRFEALTPQSFGKDSAV